MAGLWQVLRLSFSGHGWVIWLACAAAVTAAFLSFRVLAVALMLVEFVTLGSLSAQLRRRR
jgi:hypothetical protein